MHLVNCHRNSKYKFILITLTVVGIVIVSFSTKALSVSVDPKDNFIAASSVQISNINQLTFVDKGDKFSFYQMKIPFDGLIYYVVRIEGAYCKEFCLTAFFRESISNSNLMILGFLPRNSTRGDILFRLCNECSRMLRFFFVSSDGRVNAVYLSKQFIAFR